MLTLILYFGSILAFILLNIYAMLAMAIIELVFLIVALTIRIYLESKINNHAEIRRVQRTFLTIYLFMSFQIAINFVISIMKK